VTGDLVAHVTAFGRALRGRGLRVSLADGADAVEALALVDLGDRAETKRALVIALKIRPRDAAVFDALFDEFFAPGAAAPRERPAVAQVPLRPFGGLPGARLADADVERDVEEGDAPGYSPDASLRVKSFEACSAAELSALEAVLRRLVLRVATAKSRRLVPTRGRGRVDPRRSFRSAVATDGEFLRLARRARAVEEPRLVVLCDTSGSMDPHTRFLLAFLLALKKAARRAELFAFNTSLVRLTPWITPEKLKPTLERLAAAVPGWSGGTRIGGCLAEFVQRYRDEMVGSKTVVVIFSDGLDRGDTDDLARAMRAIRSRARRVVWLNPLLSDPRYEPTARGMAAALPFVDVLAPAHNLESLERLVTLVSSGPLRGPTDGRGNVARTSAPAPLAAPQSKVS